MKRLVVILATLALALGLAAVAPAQNNQQAQPPRVTGAKITELGIFTLELVKPRAGKSADQSQPRRVRRNVLKKATTEIPLTPNTTFGFNFIINGSPSGEPLRCLIKLIAPSPDGGSAPMVRQANGRYYIASDQHLSYTLGPKNQPGTYTLQLFYKGRKLLEQSFTVRKP
jgi:hypothetical protein